MADRCLRPISQITPETVDWLAKHQAHLDFDSAMGDLKRLLDAKAMNAKEFEAFIQKAKEQIGIERALEVVPIAQALGELGFRQHNPPDGEVLVWAGAHGGAELEISAGTDWFGGWQLTARCNTRRHALWDGMAVPPDVPRGAIALVLMHFWREAFGREAQVPDIFHLGARFERMKANLQALNVGLPFVELDGEILRANRKWLLQRHAQASGDVGPLPDILLTLSMANGLMSLEVEGCVYGCPVRSGWIDRCQVSLREFLALPGWAHKGKIVRLTTTTSEVRLGACSLNVLPAKTNH